VYFGHPNLHNSPASNYNKMKQNNYTSPKPTLWLAILLLLPLTLLAQVGINNSAPSAGSMLDVTSADKGILIPRMDITDLSTIAPVTGGSPDGLVVYNTSTSTGPGLFAWNTVSGRWINVDGNKDWKKGGNTGTTPGVGAGDDYIGTTDAQSFEIGTAGVSRARVEEDGQITMGFGANAANVGQQVNALGSGTDWTALGGFSGGAGTGLYGQNIANGIGVYGLNAGIGPAIYGANISTGVAVYGESFSGAPSVYGLDGPIQGDQTTFGGVAIFGLTDDPGNPSGAFLNADVAGTGIIAATGPQAIISVGSGVSANGPKIGVSAYAGEGARAAANEGNAGGIFVLDADDDISTSTGANANRATGIIAGFDNISPDGILATAQSYFGGYFSGGSEGSGTPAYAYTGLRYNTNANGTGGTNYKVIGNGTNSTIINDSNGTPRIMFSPEAPEILFQDFGVGTLVNGQARINIDPVLKQSLYVDSQHPLKVFITLEGDCNGIYVTDKSIDGFTVKELQNGISNVSFSWQIVANRADDLDANGNIASKHVGLRLPVGPGPIKPKDTKALKLDRTKYSVDRSGNTLTSDKKYSAEELKQIGTPVNTSSAKKRGQN